jgi:hypothetical protein
MVPFNKLDDACAAESSDSYDRKYTSSYFNDRQNRSIKILSAQRPLPSMLRRELLE